MFPQHPDNESLPGRVIGKAARFVARGIRGKPLVLRDAPPLVSFTFDDVPASACEYGAAILERHGARGTFYVAGSGCGMIGLGGVQGASIEQLRKIWRGGHEIGCHTYSHLPVPHLNRAELGAEIDRNRSALKQIERGIDVRNFAYPYGDFSLGAKRYLQARFDSCRSVHAAINGAVADLGALHAWPLHSHDLDREKVAALTAEAKRRRGWLIFCTHDVAERPSRYGVTLDLLEWAVGTAKRLGCVVVTVAGGLEVLGARTDDPPALRRCRG